MLTAVEAVLLRPEFRELRTNPSYMFQVANQLDNPKYRPGETEVGPSIGVIGGAIRAAAVRREIEAAQNEILNAIYSANIQSLSVAVANGKETCQRLLAVPGLVLAADDMSGDGPAEIDPRKYDQLFKFLKDGPDTSVHLAEKTFEGGLQVFPNTNLSNLCNFILAGQAWKLALEVYPRFDHNSIARDRPMIGAKAAVREELNRIMNAGQQSPGYKQLPHCLKLRSPPGLNILVSVFETYTSGQSIQDDAEVKRCFVSAKAWKSDILVRSSAVVAEDSNDLMGAGIYDTVRLGQQFSFDEFVAAIKHVYDSVDTPRAKQYREQNGVNDPEQMGVRVEPFVDTRPGVGVTASIDTMLPGVPGLVKIIFSRGEMPVFATKLDDHFYAAPTTSAVALQRRALVGWPDTAGRPEDTIKWCDEMRLSKQLCINIHDVPQAGCTALLLEMLFGRPVQIEVVVNESGLDVVQVRPLTTAWTKEQHITFPEDKTHFFEGHAVGVIEEELEVLGHNDNGNKHGVVIVSSSYLGSQCNEDQLRRIIPGTGAVVLLDSTISAHIETLCLERGVAVLTGRGKSDFKGQSFNQTFPNQQQIDPSVIDGPTVFLPSENQARILVVCTGQEGRLYFI